MPPRIDIIILSYAKDEELKELTIQTVETLLHAEDPQKIVFDVLVIESNKALMPYQFPGTRTIYPDSKFGFNKFLNIGIRATSNEYLCLCNNDLIFHNGWASALLDAMAQFNKGMTVLSPFCNDAHKNFLDLEKPTEGYFGYFAGYCFFTTRGVLRQIGPLDEKINFWYADMDFLNVLDKHKIKHYLVPKSQVTHLVSRATAGFTQIQQLRYTNYPHIYFQYKWEDKNPFLYFFRLIAYGMKYTLYSFRGFFTKIS